MGLMALVLATGLLWITSVSAQNFTSFETGDELGSAKMEMWKIVMLEGFEQAYINLSNVCGMARNGTSTVITFVKKRDSSSSGLLRPSKGAAIVWR